MMFVKIGSFCQVLQKLKTIYRFSYMTHLNFQNLLRHKDKYGKMKHV